MALGLCCQVLGPKDQNLLVAKKLQLGQFQAGAYSTKRINETYLSNIQSLLAMLPKIADLGIRCFRIGSGLFPLFEKVERNLWDNPEIRTFLKQIGDFVLSHNMRLTNHPDQFCVLSSNSERVVQNSIEFLEFQSWIFDCMGLPETPYYAINIHGGKAGQSEKLIASIQRLSKSTRSRLTLENCEFAYSVSELLEVCKKTGVPLVFDSHHHIFRDGGLSIAEALDKALATWQDGIKPLTHLSNTREEFRDSTKARELRQHSDFISYIPEAQEASYRAGLIDIEVEAKKKNLAILRMCKDFDIAI